MTKQDESEPSPGDGAPQQTIAMVPSRLGAPDVIPGPADLQPDVQLALNWQGRGYDARAWEMSAITGANTRRLRNRPYEMASLMAGMGEQLGLSCTAEREYRAWEQAGADQDPIAVEMAQRAMAELAVHYVVAVVHGLFNLASRAVALDADLHAEMGQRLNTICTPFSETRSDWLTASPGRLFTLNQIAQLSLVPNVREVVAPVAAFVSSQQWRKLDDCRGENFHRWRAQSAGLTGAAKQSPWEDTGFASAIHLGADLLGTNSQAKLAADTMVVASEARAKLVPTMNQFEQRLFAVVEATTGLNPARQ